MTYIEIALAKVYTDGRFYTYSSDKPTKIGQIVEAPFGKKNAIGIVMAIVKKPTLKLKR
jgi:primosomal protein N'